MPLPERSLLEYLQFPDPLVTWNTFPKPGKSTKTSSWARPRQVRKWDGFDFDTLSHFCSSRLRKVLEKKFSLREISSGFDESCGCSDEDSLEHNVISKWNYCVLDEALKKCQGYLKPVHGSTRMVRGGEVRSPDPNLRYRPDWGCIRSIPPNHEIKCKNLLPGDTKVSGHWSSHQIKDGLVEDTKVNRGWLRPLRQIYTYCLRNGTRYGYLITDAELVAVRIGLSKEVSTECSPSETKRPKRTRSTLVPEEISAQPDDSARDYGILEYVSFPWAVADDPASKSNKRVSINLVLFFLLQIATGKTDIGYDYGHLRDALWDQSPDDSELQALGQLPEGEENITTDEMEGVETEGANLEEHQHNKSDTNTDVDDPMLELPKAASKQVSIPSSSEKPSAAYIYLGLIPDYRSSGSQCQ
ncbi:uncharacterized protein KY384_001377 [Bacidia gigantensis]|uniref:uncharacterized protein n=1 Tax=Bacidia gigantensis TaxID=2732470 RepID=UPI001D044A72|nr:uncharacterized protein KY384_001377 [Bacidia gigantensis]KAG8533636.1 hypothetical protein KY384_001377 [Bacidia gigantensis]